MACPLCGQRKARRHCPALREPICTVCCGTKRLTEIQCPADCVYLASAREHPAAVVRRRQQEAVARLLPSIRQLSERQQQLFFLFHTAIARHSPSGFARLADSDVAEAAGTLASTLETAARGVLYEHVAQSPVAQALAAELKTLLARMREQGATVYDGEVAITLRAVEQGARSVGKPGEGDTAYLQLVARLLQIGRESAAAANPAEKDAQPSSSLIIP